MIERYRQQRRRQDAEQDADHAHRQERQDPLIGPQRGDKEMAEIARPHLLEKRHRQAELATEQHIPQHDRGEQYPESAEDVTRSARQVAIAVS